MKYMRRIDRALSEAEAKGILMGGEYGILSTASKDGQPYGVPLSYSFMGENIYFHCAREGRVIDNARKNDSVSFCVVGKTQVLPEKFSTNYESVVVSGIVSEVSGEEKQKGLLELVKKYSGGYIKEGQKYIENDGDKTSVYKIVIESMKMESGVSSPCEGIVENVAATIGKAVETDEVLITFTT